MTSDNENELKAFQYMDQTHKNDQRFLFVYLRKKFHFSKGHGSMNATGHVQSK